MPVRLKIDLREAVKLNRRALFNAIRYALEDLLPPALRDGPLGYFMVWLLYRDQTAHQTAFRRRVPLMSEAEYGDYYRRFPGLDTPTDCNEACLERILELVCGESILDVGCGRGYLADLLQRKTDAEVTGLDLQISDAVVARYPSIRFRAGKIEQLPFDDRAFDTVVCTHTLEHVIDLPRAISELRRVAARRLVLVVPKERESRYTFNLHVHFFPYPHSFLKHLLPLPAVHQCRVLQGDILYYEDRP